MKSKILSLAVVATLGLSAIAAPGYANKLSDLNEKKKEINQEKSSLQSTINEKNGELSALERDQQKLEQEMANIDHAVTDANNKIQEKNGQIETTKQQIEQLKVEITELLARIETRNELLKDRARSLQQTGGSVSYLDVLLGAQSFSDFIDRVNAVATIMAADKDILQKHKEDKASLEEKQTQVETQLVQLEDMKKELETLTVQLNKQKAEKDKLLGALELQEGQMHAEKMELEDEKALLVAQEKAIQAAIAQEQRRLAEANKPKSGSTPPASSGMFMRPTNGILTSGMGMRWGSFHAGIDIASRATNLPVVAAADGVVIRSNYSSSYGNVVFLSHSINGQIYTTVYAHLQNRFVSDGQVVSRGQTLGYMGNTGFSTGQHLHFEIHKGPWQGKTNAVNPLNYISL